VAQPSYTPRHWVFLYFQVKLVIMPNKYIQTQFVPDRKHTCSMTTAKRLMLFRDGKRFVWHDSLTKLWERNRKSTVRNLELIIYSYRGFESSCINLSLINQMAFRHGEFWPRISDCVRFLLLEIWSRENASYVRRILFKEQIFSVLPDFF
jgi:hypothetical protein